MKSVFVVACIVACGGPEMRRSPHPAEHAVVTAESEHALIDIGRRKEGEDDAACIVNRREIVVVLDFHTNEGEGKWSTGGLQTKIEQAVSAEFRKRATLAVGRVSSYSGLTIGERLIGGCTSPLRSFDKSSLAQDGSCMARVAQRLNTDWLLSGFVDPVADGYVIDAQLVSRSGGERSATVEFAEISQLPRVVQEAWSRLTLPR